MLLADIIGQVLVKTFIGPVMIQIMWVPNKQAESWWEVLRLSGRSKSLTIIQLLPQTKCRLKLK